MTRALWEGAHKKRGSDSGVCLSGDGVENGKK